MRPFATMMLALTMALPALAQEGEKKIREVVMPRFDVIPDVEIYPQADPKQALASVVKAIEKGRFDYLLAHLTEPATIDRMLDESKGSFAELMAAARAKLNENPQLLKDMRLLSREGEASEQDKLATISHKDLKDRKIFLVKVGQRWFVKNERVEKK